MTKWANLPKARPDDPEYQAGFVRWHGSDADSGPDEGITVGLGGGDVFWVGLIPDDAYDERNPEVTALGAQTGWWLILEPGAEPVAKFTNRHDAKLFSEMLAKALKGARRA